MLGTDDLGRTVGEEVQVIALQPELVIHLGQFDRACVNVLSLVVCPENRRNPAIGAHPYLENSTACHKSMPIVALFVMLLIAKNHCFTLLFDDKPRQI